MTLLMGPLRSKMVAVTVRDIRHGPNNQPIVLPPPTQWYPPQDKVFPLQSIETNGFYNDRVRHHISLTSLRINRKLLVLEWKHVIFTFVPYIATLSNFNFHPLEVVHRYRDTQLQVGENY